LKCGSGDGWRRSVGQIMCKKEVLHRVKEERTILQTIKIRKGNWRGHILCRNCLLKHVIERKKARRIEVTGRQGRRLKQLLDDPTEKRGYWKLKEEALDRKLWKTYLLWKRLWTIHKADYRIYIYIYIYHVDILMVFCIRCETSGCYFMSPFE
jgi:hypothetical protein